MNYEKKYAKQLITIGSTLLQNFQYFQDNFHIKTVQNERNTNNVFGFLIDSLNWFIWIQQQ